MSPNNVTVLYAATIVTAHSIHSRCTVVSCLRGDGGCRYRVGGIGDHGSALYRVKDNPGKR